MGELGLVNSKGDVSTEEARLGFGSRWKSSPPPDPASISEECLSAAEEAAEQVLNCVHPTLDSEEKRRDVIDYVVSYGSVPLKTYLPDGDIDLTVLKGPNAGESLAHDVLALLQDEEQNENAEYQVKETQFIDAEVKLVKCLVRNFVIDISFNQLGGLSTLCFLEQALYRFLDYYSQFDWENYCISLKGPVCKSSLPDVAVKMPEGGWNDMLLSEKFMENCLELFSVPSRGLEANPRAFQTKHLNIIDPLRENNNLGRSVHRGNFYRIRSAFKFGAHKLGQALLLPRDKVADEICRFFANTRARHEHQYRSSIRRLAHELGDEESLSESLSSPVELFSEDDMPLRSSVSDFDSSSVGVGQTPTLDFATSNSSLRNGTSESSNYSASLSDHKPHYLSSKSSAESGSSEVHQFDFACDSENREKYVEMNNTYRWCMDDSETFCITGPNSTPKVNVLENLSLDFREIDSTSVGGESEAFNPLADLSGDYDGNIRSLLRGQLCHVSASFATVMHNRPPPPSRIQNKKPWDIVRQSMPLRQNEFSQMNSHTISTDSTLYPGADNTGLHGTAFHFDGKQKARGTGTYFPHMNGFYMEKPSQGRGRYRAPDNHNHLHRYGHINGVYPACESNSFENGSHEVLPARRKFHGRKRRSDVQSQSHRSVGGGNQINGYLSASCRIEFGSIGNLGEEVISGSAHVRGSTVGVPLKPQLDMVWAFRVAGQSIRLKNEDEFPPLCQ
ncbi:hypothetical protein DH2020_022032 [Rehmannia glutinosa]|uniref:PAP/OAS1 substrate-binding-related domain-containing protein n=1 Tax=Rehmannia glutinosa TaxID=99300 RepID=A0ABR0WFY1_REHGL